jgi:hypothetical protein
LERGIRFDFPDNRLHTLDTDIWLEGRQIMNSYYQKEMKSPYLLMDKSTMFSQQKLSIISNELMRRLGNIGPVIPIQEKTCVVEKFIQEMKNSSYDKGSPREAVISGLEGFKTRLEKKTKNPTTRHQRRHYQK